MPVTTAAFTEREHRENCDNEASLFLRLQNIFLFKTIYTFQGTFEENERLALITNSEAQPPARPGAE